MTPPPRAAIIGVGGISKFYIDACRATRAFDVTTVCDIDESRAHSLRDRGINGTTSLDEIVNDPCIDVVIVDVPVPSHYDVCRAAIEAKKHVCCEKPLTGNLHQARDLSARAQQHDVILFTAFHRRYNRHLQDALPIVASGDVVNVEAWYLEDIADHSWGADWYSAPATAGGGCIIDNGPNVSDPLRMLFGAISVKRATVSRQSDGTDIAATIMGTVGDNVPATIHLDWAFPGEWKAIEFRLRDGHTKVVDLLRGHSDFKSSLPHEYEALVIDFANHVGTAIQPDGGLESEEWLDAVFRCCDARSIDAALVRRVL